MDGTMISESLRRGALVGGILAFVSLVGALTAFADKYVVTGVLSFSHMLLIAGGLAAGVPTTIRSQQPIHRHPWTSVALSGALAGGAAMLLLSILAALITRVDLRAVLVNATPRLVQVLTFGQDLPHGLILLIGMGLLLGLMGALSSLLSANWKQVVLAGLGAAAVGGLLSDKGLSIPWALLVAVLAAGAAYLQRRIRPVVAQNFHQLKARNRAVADLLAWGLGLTLLGLAPVLFGKYGTSVLDLVGLYAIMGLGLNIVVGYAGLLDLGYVAFFAIGAYVTGLLTSPASVMGLGWPFWAAWPIAIVAAASAGVILGIPVLRLRGDYLAIVTLGFGEIIRILVLSDTFKKVLGGAQGIIEIPGPTLAGFQFIQPQHFYYLIALGCLAAVFVSLRLGDSRVGRAWMAIREDEDVAQAMGINLVRYKLLAFAMGAAFSGAVGAIFASWLHAIFPNSFTLLVSINILSLVIVGGVGSIPGVILGALVLVGLPEVLREFADFRMLAFGALLVIMMLARPEGLLPARQRRRELREVDIA